MSRLGYAGAIWIVLAVVATILWRRPAIAAYVAAAVWSADLIALGLKALADRPRPFEVAEEPEPLLLAVGGQSFPSGHGATAAAGALALSRFLPHRWPVFALLALAIGYSRIYVGVHYPADVLAGAALGVLVATALPMLAATLPRSRRSRPGG